MFRGARTVRFELGLFGDGGCCFCGCGWERREEMSGWSRRREEKMLMRRFRGRVSERVGWESGMVGFWRGL